MILKNSFGSILAEAVFIIMIVGICCQVGNVVYGFCIQKA